MFLKVLGRNDKRRVHYARSPIGKLIRDLALFSAVNKIDRQFLLLTMGV
jgi:hypothetical protein